MIFKNLEKMLKSCHEDTMCLVIFIIALVIVIGYALSGRFEFFTGTGYGKKNTEMADGEEVYIKDFRGRYIGLTDSGGKMMHGRSENTKFLITKVGTLYAFYNPLTMRFLGPVGDGSMLGPNGEKMSDRKELTDVANDVGIYNSGLGKVGLYFSNVGKYACAKTDGTLMLRTYDRVPSQDHYSADKTMLFIIERPGAPVYSVYS